MWITSIPIGQWLTIMVMALALGFDAFSLCLGIGIKGIRGRDMVRISLMIALFHIAMPLLGILTGIWMSAILGQITVIAAGALLVMLGAHMVYSSFKGESSGWIDTATLGGTMLFALSVSVDSFSVGVSLGMYQSHMLMTITAFGLLGGLMSILGLKLGNQVGQHLGEYGEAAGGAILLTFGVLFLLPG
ncbi:manganese efflux pump MntP family protein [Paenibacillus taiwanensis]|uniref:manganese efflux pump MntP n=1 Tax=Paenibacillus taiwanensis TaxID=401638 RepID=UPI00040D2846|nr:manganese efflux pump [Paenibacillus taiwanensis]